MALPQRKLHRLKTWDYSENGYYFITICTKGKNKCLSQLVQNGFETEVFPTKIGRIVLDCWKQLACVSPYVKTDAFCLMPNHIHGIIVIEKPFDATCPSISSLVRGFKSSVTRQYNALVLPEKKNSLWQSSFYDEIIRNDEMLCDIRNYILGNPSKWMDDPMFVE